MATGNNLIEAALRRIGRLGSGESATAQELADGVLEFNRMLGSWNAEIGPIYSETSETLSWVGGQATRTIGVGGDLNTTRPQQILEASLTVLGTDYPLDIKSHQWYQAISDKTNTSSIPQALAYNPSFTSSLAQLFMYPIPVSAVSLLLISLKPIADITGAGTITFPPGYEDAFVLNLAVRFADGDYASEIPQPLRDEAVNAKVRLIRLNDITQEMMPDYMAPGLNQRGDYVNRWTH